MISKNKLLYLIKQLYFYIKHWGVYATCRHIKRVLAQKIQMKKAYIPNFQTKDLLTLEETTRQRKHHFSKDIKFSILVPLYNTDENLLREMIESVISQTYQNWELCLSDGSDNMHANVESICNKFVCIDSRIQYKKLANNMGISGNTNECIEMASGEYIALVDHDDLLHPSALFEVMNVICAQNADFIYTDETTFRINPTDAYQPHRKPDYAPDTLRANNYICHMTVFDRALLEKTGYFRSECDGSQDFDIVLRLTEQAKSIVHIPQILYYWRAHINSVALNIDAKPYVFRAAKRAISDHLKRIGIKGEVEDSDAISIYRIRYEIQRTPKVSILIHDNGYSNDLERCVQSIFRVTTYQNYEVIVIANGNNQKRTFAYCKKIKKNGEIKSVTCEKDFSYSKIINFGAQHATGDYLLLIDNNVEIISPAWIEEMLMFAQRPDVGAVGAKLYYPDNTIQHAGLAFSDDSICKYLFEYYPRTSYGYMGRLAYAQNLSAVSFACAMIPREVYKKIGILNESFPTIFGDVDYCMRLRKAGYLIVFTPFAELYHYKSKSSKKRSRLPAQKCFDNEFTMFQALWREDLKNGDPYYNSELLL